MSCEVLTPCVILVFYWEEVVVCIDYVGECRCLVKCVLVGIGARRCGIAGGEWCGEVCLIFLGFFLAGIVRVKYVYVELCEVTEEDDVQLSEDLEFSVDEDSLYVVGRYDKRVMLT